MNPILTPFEALVKAIERAGSQTALAAICGVSQNAVWKWVQSSKRLPAQHVLAVEATTGIPRHWLRPDIYPADLSPAGQVLTTLALRGGRVDFAGPATVPRQRRSRGAITGDTL